MNKKDDRITEYTDQNVVEELTPKTEIAQPKILSNSILT